MTEQTEAFPLTPAERNLREVRKHLIAESENRAPARRRRLLLWADEALERAEAKVESCRMRVMWLNEALDNAERADEMERGIIAYKVDTTTGEVQS